MMVNEGFADAKCETIVLASGIATVDQVKTGFFLKHALGKAVMEKDRTAFEIIAGKFETEIEKRYGAAVSFPMSALLTTGLK